MLLSLKEGAQLKSPEAPLIIIEASVIFKDEFTELNSRLPKSDLIYQTLYFENVFKLPFYRQVHRATMDSFIELIRLHALGYINLVIIGKINYDFKNLALYPKPETITDDFYYHCSLQKQPSLVEDIVKIYKKQEKIFLLENKNSYSNEVGLNKRLARAFSSGSYGEPNYIFVKRNESTLSLHLLLTSIYELHKRKVA